jgi:dihydroorotate dehydrogenase (NAD+) catalytic subunit
MTSSNFPSRRPRRGVRRRTGRQAGAVDLTTRVGGVELRAPVMTASGTSGHGADLGAYVDLGVLGAVVCKSLLAGPWPGNPPPRVHETPAGMLNSVGLQGPGVDQWLADDVPALVAAGATVVASVWGRTIEDYAEAAEALAGAPPEVVAVEVNVSCPNHHARHEMFAHDPEATFAALAATASVGRPRWAKLSPNVTHLPDIAAAAVDAGADAVTLINTLMGMSIDTETAQVRLGGRGGGLSGPAIHPVAVRAVFDVRAALPGLPIVAAGGVASGIDAVEFLMAGASAVQVGTATFAEPGAVGRVLDELESWCARRGVASVSELVGLAHG